MAETPGSLQKTALSHPTTPYQVDIPDYCTELIAQLSVACETAHQNIAQHKQQHDKGSQVETES